MKILVTGGAGFIGSALIRFLIQYTEHSVLNLDKLTYAGDLQSLAEVSGHPRYSFVQLDIADTVNLVRILQSYQPDVIMHLAAETHVDRSIGGPAAFIQTNIVGTYFLLEACRQFWQQLSTERQIRFRFHHISTDEVYGDLGDSKELFTEHTRYAPSSPYSASKAASDHLVRAWHRTYGLPVVISNCSNNYGPYHFPEKLIPLTIINAISAKSIPIYGNGQQIRDWLYVDDHVRALYRVVCHGIIGETYNIGGHNEIRNIDVVTMICELLEEIAPDKPPGVKHYVDLMTFVADRPGHDKRYAIDSQKIANELGWLPEESFRTGLRKTVQWYLQNAAWWQAVMNKRNLSSD